MNKHMRSLDEVDYYLLKLLQKENMRPAQLSEKLKKLKHPLSANACRNRVEDLERDSFIKRYVALLEPLKLELFVVCFLLVRIGDKDRETVAAFKAKFIADARVLEFYEVLGPNDFVLKVRVKNNDEAIQFSEDLNPFVGTVESIIVGRVHKEATELPITIPEAVQ